MLAPLHEPAREVRGGTVSPGEAVGVGVHRLCLRAGSCHRELLLVTWKRYKASGARGRNQRVTHHWVRFCESQQQV
jgi:hypothetical protein